MRVKRIYVYLHGGSLYCPFCGKKIDLEYYEEEPCKRVGSCKHVVFIARRLIDELPYFADELLYQISEMLDREPWRGDDILFTYISDKYREVYERVYGKPPTCTQEDYLERGSIKIKDAVNLLKTRFWSSSDIILFKVRFVVPSSGHGPGPSYVDFIALIKDGYIIT
jgi:hypothetical protein